MSINSDDLRARVPPLSIQSRQAQPGYEYDDLSLKPLQITSRWQGATQLLTGADVLLSNFTATLTVRQRSLVRVEATVSFQMSTIADWGACIAYVDGVTAAALTPLGTPYSSVKCPTIPAGGNFIVAIPYLAYVVLPPGQHTVELRGKALTNVGGNSFVIDGMFYCSVVGKASL